MSIMYLEQTEASNSDSLLEPFSSVQSFSRSSTKALPPLPSRDTMSSSHKSRASFSSADIPGKHSFRISQPLPMIEESDGISEILAEDAFLLDKLDFTNDRATLFDIFDKLDVL